MKYDGRFYQMEKIKQEECGSSAELVYIAKLEEYIDFMHEHGIKDAIFCAAHGQVDKPETIAKAKKLRNELAVMKAAI